MMDVTYAMFAQVGVGGDFGKAAVIGTAILLAWILLGLVAAAFFAWGLYHRHARRGVITAVVAGLSLVGLATPYFILAYEPVEKVTIDLSTSRTPPEGKWTGYAGVLLQNYDGRLAVDLTLPHGLTYQGDADVMSLRREGDKVVDVSIQCYGLSKDEAKEIKRKYASWEGRHGSPGDPLGEIDGTIRLSRIYTGDWMVRLKAYWSD